MGISASISWLTTSYGSWYLYQVGDGIMRVEAPLLGRPRWQLSKSEFASVGWMMASHRHRCFHQVDSSLSWKMASLSGGWQPPVGGGTCVGLATASCGWPHLALSGWQPFPVGSHASIRWATASHRWPCLYLVANSFPWVPKLLSGWL